MPMSYKYSYKFLSMRKILIAFLLLFLSVFTCDFNPNSLPLVQGTPRLVASVPNGERYMIGDVNDPLGNYLYVVRMKGTAYEMGKAFGQLFKQQLKIQLQNFYNYYVTYLQQAVQQKSLPPFIAKFLVKNVPLGLNTVLDLNVLVTKRYTNKRYFEQIRGIADGAGFGAKAITRLNIFPEYVKAACTVAGIWGSASANNKTLHMRALDWDAGNPINKYPLLAIYHPSAKGAQKHVNIGYVGFVGVLTGMSEKISIGEKVWLPPKHSVKMTRFGNPWTYVLRDLLYDATDMKSAIKMLTQTPRTCAIHLGIASLHDHNFRMFEYSQNILNNYDDTNYTHYTAAHQKMKGVAFFDKHVQPSNDACVSQLLSNPNYYQKWTMESFWRVVGGSHQTGNTQLVVFDLEEQKFMISYSRNVGKKTEDAFKRSPILVNMVEMWKDF